MVLTGWPSVFHSSSIRQKLVNDLVSTDSSDLGRHCLPQNDRWLPMLFLLFMVRLVSFTMSLQILRLSPEISSSKVSPSWILESENGSLLYSSS